MQIFCKNCGNPIDVTDETNEVFCPNCGQPHSVFEEENAPEQELVEESSLEEENVLIEETISMEEPEVKTNKKKPIIIIALIALVIAIVATATVLIVKNNVFKPETPVKEATIQYAKAVISGENIDDAEKIVVKDSDAEEYLKEHTRDAMIKTFKSEFAGDEMGTKVFTDDAVEKLVDGMIKIYVKRAEYEVKEIKLDGNIATVNIIAKTPVMENLDMAAVQKACGIDEEKANEYVINYVCEKLKLSDIKELETADISDEKLVEVTIDAHVAYYKSIDFANKYFSAMLDQLKTVALGELECKATLVKNGGKWLIEDWEDVVPEIEASEESPAVK